LFKALVECVRFDGEGVDDSGEHLTPGRPVDVVVEAAD